MPATTGMKGSGFYDQHSTAQLASIRCVSDWIAGAVAELAPSPGRPITLLDLGSSEGRNAILTMADVVAALRRSHPEQAIQVIYSDLASNNFNGLFRNLEEARRDRTLYASAVAGSFYRQLVPSATVDFATSFNAVVWLDQLPAVRPRDFVSYRRPHPPRPGLVIPAALTAAFAEQAAADPVHFLTARARELAPGGKLLIVTPGDAPEGRLCDGIYDLLNDACLDLVASGRIPRTRYEALTMPVYCRTIDELRAPLEDLASPLHTLFRIDRAETLEVPVPFIEAHRHGGPLATYADEYTGFLRAFSEPVARAALAPDAAERGVIDELYERVRARALAEPEHYRFRYFIPSILLTRR